MKGNNHWPRETALGMGTVNIPSFEWSIADHEKNNHKTTSCTNNSEISAVKIYYGNPAHGTLRWALARAIAKISRTTFRTVRRGRFTADTKHETEYIYAYKRARDYESFTSASDVRKGAHLLISNQFHQMK